MKLIGKQLKYIECAYWSCPHQTVYFPLGKNAEKGCKDEKKGWMNLEGHEGSNAPAWCQRRKENGGNDA